MFNKRGISPLIATVLILGFTVALAAVIMTWGTGFTKRMQESVEKTTERQMTMTSDVMIDIKSIKLAGNKIKLLIENSGSRDIEKFKVRVHGSSGVDSVESNSGLEAYGIGSILVDFNPTVVGALESVEAIPVINLDGEEFVSSNVYDKEDAGAEDIGFDSDEGLIAYYNFNEGSGSTVKDGSKNGNDGILIGVANWVDGVSGKALRFTGSEYVRVPDDPSFDTGSEMTLELWFKAEDVSSAAAWDFLVGKSPYWLPDGDYGIYQAPAPADRIAFFVGNAGGCQGDYFQISPDIWYFVAGVYDGVNRKMYVNGDLVIDTPCGGKTTNNDYDFTIGTEHDGIGNYLFKGIIDEVKVYNYAKTY